MSRSTRLSVLVLTSTVLLALPTLGFALPPWPVLGHDAQLTGQSQFSTSTNTGQLKWRFTTGRIAGASVAIANDGTIYYGTASGSPGDTFYAINPNGSQK